MASKNDCPKILMQSHYYYKANSESQQGGLYGEYPLDKVEAMYQ